MSKKILLADDSITIQKVVELTFSDGDYEVIATNNGTKAIEEIPKVKPDIILSDIIMPEKNGYEVCEWVKSHPEYRNIPVILLTGTFEPFDPDRAEKAGCDAVVTKPFESQSLIQKVEELIARRAEAFETTSPQRAAEEPLGTEDTDEESPGLDESMMAEEPSGAISPPPPAPPSFEMGTPGEDSGPFGGAESRPLETTRESTPFPPEEEEPRPHGDVFGESAPPTAEDRDEDEDSATRMIPKMTMDDIQRIQQEQKEQPAESEDTAMPASPQAPSPPSMSFEDAEDSPFEASAEETPRKDESSETIPGMTMDEIRRREEQPAGRQPEPEAAPFGETAPEERSAGDAAPFGSDFGTPSRGEEAPSSAPAQEEPEEDFDDTATRMTPKLAFDDIQRMRQEQEQEEREDESAAPETPEMVEAGEFGMGLPGPSQDGDAANPFAAEAEAEEPLEQDADEEPPTPFTDSEPELLPAPPHPPAEPVSQEPEPEATAGSAHAEAPAAASLSEEQVDRIARRVVELLSDKAIREIAWEVIPETAEMIVRARIRELEREEA